MAARIKFLFYFASKHSERVKYFFQHEKGNFVSPSDHVMLFYYILLYKHQKKGAI